MFKLRSFYPVFFFVLVLLLSSCDLLTARVVEDEIQKQISFRCSGSTNPVLRDYCQTNSSIKLLIANMNVNDITGLQYEITGDRGDVKKQEKVSIEMEEVILVELNVPSSVGTPIDISMIPIFLTGRGIESCDSEMLLFENIRTCTNS